MDNIVHPALIEEWKKILMMLLMKKLNKYVNIPSKEKEIDCNYKTEYWPTIIK